MKSVEPTFDRSEEFWPPAMLATEGDVRALEDTIAQQSAELKLRLTEVLDLYNAQSQQAAELEAAYNEIARLKKSSAVLQSAAMQQRTASVAAQDEIVRLQNENASLSDQLALALQDIENSSARIKAMQTTLDTRDANAASALAQINHLSSELTVASAERFKLVATVYGEKRRQNQKASFWEDKVKAAEARAATRKAQVEHLEEVRREYDKRIHLLEALLESERDVAQRRLSQLPT